MSNREPSFFAALMGGLVACLLLIGLYIWKISKPIQVVKVDVQSLIRQQAQHLSEQQLSKENEQAALTQTMLHLKKVLADQDPNLILLDASIVLSSQVPDMTNSISQQLKDLDHTQLSKGKQF